MSRLIIDRLTDILIETQLLLKLTEKHSIEEIIEDPYLSRSVERSLEIIGEAAKHLPENFKEQHNQIPWSDIAAMRNIIIHEYFRVDPIIIKETLSKDIPDLHNTIKSILRFINENPEE